MGDNQAFGSSIGNTGDKETVKQFQNKRGRTLQRITGRVCLTKS